MNHPKKFLTLVLFIAAGSEFTTANTSGIVVNSKLLLTDDERTVPGFSEITVSGRHNVYITIGNTESLRLEGDSDAINEIETKVEDGVLKIRNKKQMNTRNWNNSSKVNIYIQAKRLNNLVISGSGDISIIADKQLDAVVSGSGDIRYGGNASVNSTKSGSGNISKGL